MAESIKQQEQQRMDRVVAQIKKAQKKAQKNKDAIFLKYRPYFPTLSGFHLPGLFPVSLFPGVVQRRSFLIPLSHCGQTPGTP